MTATTSGFDLRAIPMPGPLRLPAVTERLLPNGLRVVTARRAAVPLIEACLSIPFNEAASGPAVVLASSLVSGRDIQGRLRAMGGGMSAAVDTNRLRIAGSSLAEHLPDFVALLARLAVAAEYPADEVATNVSLALQDIEIMRADSRHRVLEALNRNMFGQHHPYGHVGPSAAEVAAVDRDVLLDLHSRRVRPNRATLVVVGDLDPDEVLDLVAEQFAGWEPGAEPVAISPTPAWRPSHEIIDMPGASQSLLRMAMPCPRHGDPDYSALAMASMCFGGYFSSRLVQNIREDKGFSYSPRSGILHVEGVSLVTVTMDVVPANTVAATEELSAELATMVSCPVGFDELDRARRYVAGNLRLQLSTSTGLAGALLELEQYGLPLDWLVAQDDRLASVTPDQVTQAAGRYLATEQAVSVLLCDSATVFPATERER